MNLAKLQKKARVVDPSLNKVPAGFKTIEQIAKENKLSNVRASEVCRQLREAGLLEGKKFRVVIASGRRQEVWHYREFPNK